MSHFQSATKAGNNLSSLKILIIEDIRATSDLIKKRISILAPDISAIDQVYSLEEAEIALQNKEYDILLLDIHLPGGTSFDLLKKLEAQKAITFETIFITGQKESEYVMNAIKFSAIDYLFKPVEDELLHNAIIKAKEKISLKKRSTQISLLLELLADHDKGQVSRIALHLSKGIIKFFEVAEISHLQADGVVTKVIMLDETEHIATKNLGYYKPFLIAEHSFFPISNSILVNMSQVDNYSHSNLNIQMKNNVNLSASRRGGKEFKNHMMNRVQNGNSILAILKKLFN